MNQEQKNQVIEMLAIQYEMKEQSVSENVISYIIKQLEPYGYDPVMKALDKLGKESSYKINLAEIIKRIDDGRPSAQVAWSEIPKSEIESKVLTKEQNIALCAVSAMIDSGDMIPARMAFIEKYNELVEESRANAEPVKYVLASGFDKQGRIDAVSDAVQSGKLLKIVACHMLGYEHDNKILALESPMESAIMIEHDEGDVFSESLAHSLRWDR
jgi:hypothetical protein